MSDEAREELRVAFTEMLGAERRLRGREGQRPDELSLSHYRMLSCLLDAGRLPAGRLATAAGLSPATMSQMLDLLEGRDFIRRERDPADRRVVVAAITPEGRRLTEERRTKFRALWDEQFADLGAEQIAAGVTVLEHITRLLETIAERKAPAPAKT